MSEAVRDFTHGNPALPRVVCVTCSTLAYAVEIRMRDAEYLVKAACPRKPRCRPWVDMGCRIERREPPAPAG